MKKLFIFIFFCSAVAFAQKKDYKRSLQGIKKVTFKSNVSIKVVAGSGNELVIAERRKNRNHDRFDNHFEQEEHEEHQENGKKRKTKKDRREGLRPIYPGGEDTTKGLGYSVTEENGELIIVDLKSYMQRRPVTITLPKTMNINVDAGNLGGVSIDGFTSEVEVDTNVGTIDLKNVTGPITAHTSTGTINVDFATVSQSSPITISTSVGIIDVSLPTNTKANLDIKTNGTVYTNFDFKAPDKKGLPNRSGLKNIRREINGGGVKIKLKSSLGDIFLRKK